MDEKIVFNLNDLLTAEQAMKLAIHEAYKGAAHVSPNPLVGCVIVDAHHRLISTGYHAKYGGPHAEADALQKLSSSQLIQATVYVTLEPCAHQGKTPSCAKALAKLPIKKVVYGLIDPNPLVSGQGANILRDSGIEAEEYQGSLKIELEEVCEAFLKNFRHKKIFVAAKVAQSLDGVIALKNGESKWITGSDSRELVHELRSRYDAIVVGRNTVEVDDPSLNVRHPNIQKEMKLVILDSQQTILKKIKSGQHFKFLDCHKPENIFFAVENVSSAFSQQQISFESLVDLNEKLLSYGIRSVFVEGGAATYSSFLKEKLIDRLHLFMANTVIGQNNGISWTSHYSSKNLEDVVRLKNSRIQKIGSDFYITGTL